MAYQAIVFHVMIASPSDVVQERQIVRDVVHEWNSIQSTSMGIVLMPIGWDTHATPEMGDRPQAIINKQVLEQSDLLVGVFWTRIGTPTGDHVSGTVEEIEEHVASGKPAMLYFSNTPVMPDSVDQEQYNTLREFKEACREQGLVREYDNVNDFRDKFRRDLGNTVNRHEYFRSELARIFHQASDLTGQAGGG